MKVLITGATGFIGNKIAHTLVEQKEFTVGCLVRTSSNKNHIEAMSDIADAISIFYANFTDYHAVRNIVKSFAPNFILHVGALTPVRDSFEMPHEFNETNYIGTINLVHAALMVPDFKKFIFASTMEVYGWQQARVPFSEDTLLHPASPYAVSKAACEYYIEMAAKAYGLPYLISRACNTYGRRNNAGFIVEYIVTSMLLGKDVYIGTPHAVRDLLYADDHVSAYMTLLHSSFSGEKFNFGTGEGISMLDLAHRIGRKLDFKGDIIQHFPPNYPFRPVAEEYLSINPQKAKDLLQWMPQYSLDAGLDITIEFWRKKLEVSSS